MHSRVRSENRNTNYNLADAESISSLSLLADRSFPPDNLNFRLYHRFESSNVSDIYERSLQIRNKREKRMFQRTQIDGRSMKLIPRLERSQRGIIIRIDNKRIQPRIHRGDNISRWDDWHIIPDHRACMRCILARTFPNARWRRIMRCDLELAVQ